jgi:hypothetical protein
MAVRGVVGFFQVLSDTLLAYTKIGKVAPLAIDVPPPSVTSKP